MADKNITIDINNLSYVDYLWTKKSDDGSSIEGIRLSPLNLPTDVIYTADLPTALPNPKALTFGSKTYNGSTAQTITASDLNAVNKSGDRITGKITIQSGDPSGCLQLGADVSSNTLTANTRKLARLTFPTKEYGTTKTCSIMSCDNLNGYNYVEFGGHIGDATNTAPDFLYFAVDKTHNSLSPTTKELVMAVSPTSLNLFNGAADAGNITNFSNLSSKWVFNNSNTFKNSGYTYTLPNITGTIALTSNIPTVNNATLTIQQSGKNVATFTANSSKNVTANIVVPNKTSELTNDAGFTTNIGTITEIKVNGTSIGTSGPINLTNMVTFASSQTAIVAGTSKTTYTYNQPTGDSNTGSSNGSAYFPEGIIMGGTAASAGLVTRGICGVATPDATTGACAKENLYINYDGTNDYQSNRQLVIQAGSVGTHYGNNLYQYAAARGDAVKNYCDATYAAKSHTHNYVATDTIATSTTLGLVKSSTTGTTANRDYKVQVNPDGTMKVNVPWTDNNTDTHYTNYLQIKGNGTEAVKFTQNANKSLNLKPGSNVSISVASGEITISSANTNTSHSHSAGVGLVGSGSAGTSGTYTYKAKLRSETALTVDSAAATTLGRVYPVAVDKSGYLSLNVSLAGFEDILKGIKGRTQVEWNALNAGEYGSNSTYNGTTLPPVILENSSGFWNSASGKSLDISFHFAKKERITTLQVKCPPYSGVNPTMTVYYAQKGDTGLTLYKEIATISTADSKTYEFNKEGISADYWVIRFTSSGWIDLRLCSPGGLFTTGLYTKECHQQIMDRFGGYQPIGNYALKSEIDNTYVKYSAAQSLNDTQKTQARANIGAGTSNFTGYTSSNKLHTDYINNAAGWTSNKGTVTSVRVQAGTGLSSSQNTAQTSTLNTTISIASGYKLPTETEWAERPSINDAYSISAGNGIVLTPSASSLEISVNSTSSVISGSSALVTSGAVYSAIQSAITTALNTSV